MNQFDQPFLHRSAANAAEPSQASTSAPQIQPIGLTELGSDDTDASFAPLSSAPPLMSALAAADHPLRQVKAKLTVCIGTAELMVGELLDAKEHQVLTLDRKVEQAVDILLEGQVIARGALVAVDGHFAVRISELPLPLDASRSAKPTR